MNETKQPTENQEQKMTKPKFNEWFCLAEGHDNFEVDPVLHGAHLFGELEWKEEIDARLRKAQTLKSPVRLVWWADYGMGKTHRMHHMRHTVKERGYAYRPCYVVVSDLQEKTGFEKLHYEMINSLGRDEMFQIVSSYLLKLRNGIPGVPTLHDLCGTSSDLVSAFKMFGGDNENLRLPAWRYLCGLELDNSDMKLAMVAKPSLETGTEFSTCLATMAAIIRSEEGKELLYLIDEADKLKQITNKTAEARWLEALRAIIDVKHVSFVFGIGAERQEGLPKLILFPEIVRRIQRDNYKKMEAYKSPETKSFVRDLLKYWINPAKRSALEQSENLTSTVADYDPELYPFTTGAFEKFCEWACVDPRSAKPSEIVPRLNNVAVEAYERGSRLITRNLLSEMQIA